MADLLLVTNSPKAATKSAHTGSAQHNNQFLTRLSQANQQNNGAMPHYGGGADKCARCSKSVYLAERKAGAGRSFHSSCFSCRTCNRKLDATTLSEHKGEIYCKTCYTRQFGMHGLVSGVTMSTEQPTREVRHSRRSSYGSDLDAPVITHQQVRQRAHSNDNMLRGEHSAIQHDELPKMFPWRNDVLPENIPPSSSDKSTNGIDHLVDKKHPSPQRPISQIGFERVIESTGGHNYSRLSSQNSVDNDRHRSALEKDGTSAIVDMPVIPSPKRSNSQIERVEMPALPGRHDERSRSPSPTSNDVYRRQTSRERPADISDNFARLTLNENQRETNHHDYLNENQSETNHHDYLNEHLATTVIAKENPLVKRTDSYAKANDDHKINRSRDSSPSETNNSNRSPSPTSGYGSSSVHGEGRLRDSTSPPSAFVPQHDYLNTQPAPSHVVDRSPSSPRQTERTTSAMRDFVSSTSHISPPQLNGKYSALGALVKPLRPMSSQPNTPSDDDLIQ